MLILLSVAGGEEMTRKRIFLLELLAMLCISQDFTVFNWPAFNSCVFSWKVKVAMPLVIRNHWVETVWKWGTSEVPGSMTSIFMEMCSFSYSVNAKQPGAHSFHLTMVSWKKSHARWWEYYKSSFFVNRLSFLRCEQFKSSKPPMLTRFNEFI